MASAQVLQQPSRSAQIADVATRLFSERGYHGTSMRDIAEGSGIRAASLYAHIARKEDLLYGIVSRAAERFMVDVDGAARSAIRPRDRLRAAMRAHVRVVADDVRAARVFHHEWTALAGQRRQEVVRLRDRYERLWDGIVRELPGAVDPKLARLLVLSAANWVYTWYDPDGPLSPEDVADRYTDLLLKGLGARGAGVSGNISKARKVRA
jgi:TetR/AcrR family transcriptional regulator, cholesterol catabolism regulator